MTAFVLLNHWVMEKQSVAFEPNNVDKGILELPLAACSGFAKPPITISFQLYTCQYNLKGLFCSLLSL